MIYRIEVEDTTTSHRFGIRDRTAGTIMDRNNLVVPPQEFFTKNSTCWFTELGWQKYGEKLFSLTANECHEFDGIDERVVLMLAPEPISSKIIYQDAYQIILF